MSAREALKGKVTKRTVSIPKLLKFDVVRWCGRDEEDEADLMKPFLYFFMDHFSTISVVNRSDSRIFPDLKYAMEYLAWESFHFLCPTVGPCHRQLILDLFRSREWMNSKLTDGSSSASLPAKSDQRWRNPPLHLGYRDGLKTFKSRA